MRSTIFVILMAFVISLSAQAIAGEKGSQPKKVAMHKGPQAVVQSPALKCIAEGAMQKVQRKVDADAKLIIERQLAKHGIGNLGP